MEAIRAGPNQWDRCPYKGNWDTDAEIEPCDGRSRVTIDKAEKPALLMPDFGLLALGLWREIISLFKLFSL